MSQKQSIREIADHMVHSRWVEKNRYHVLRIQSCDTRKSIQGVDLMVQKSSITISQAFEGMILSKQAEGKSVNTINDYGNLFQKLALFFSSEPAIDTIGAGLASHSQISADHC
jgi:hypothetical protein